VWFLTQKQMFKSSKFPKTTSNLSILLSFPLPNPAYLCYDPVPLLPFSLLFQPKPLNPTDSSTSSGLVEPAAHLHSFPSLSTVDAPAPYVSSSPYLQSSLTCSPLPSPMAAPYPPLPGVLPTPVLLPLPPRVRINAPTPLPRPLLSRNRLPTGSTEP
jgi:hypothetical protein